jgi:hypothetical protein
MTPPQRAIELTEEQRVVVDAPVDDLLLVSAGAGTGKTLTLVHRLAELVSRNDAHAGQILILTFSRAAVREIRDRLGTHGRGVDQLRVQTFDAWALAVLRSIEETTDWVNRSFDERIRAATSRITQGDADDLYENDLRHVVVDEVQDLVGARRNLVQALTERFDSGATFFGDIAQAIYGFQSGDDDAGAFVRWLRRTFAGELVERHLTTNFRAQSVDAEVALPYGSKLQEAAAAGGYTDAHKVLYADLLRTLGETIDVGKPGSSGFRDTVNFAPGRTAILARDNGTALVVSNSLREAGIGHQLQRSATDRSLPPWVAHLFALGETNRIGRAELGKVLPDDADAEFAWMRLRAITGGPRSDSLDLHRLAHALSEGRFPDQLAEANSADVVVSSIHRAKGLEFERVIIIEPRGRDSDENNDVGEEARLVYVAMTRTRNDLFRAGAPKSPRLRREPGLDRWSRPGYKAGQRFGLEIKSGDVGCESPEAVLSMSGREIQTQLISNVEPGDEVSFERIGTGRVDPETPLNYQIVHNGHAIGVLSKQFIRDLRSYMGKNAYSYPSTITDVHVEGFETVVGAPNDVGHGALPGAWLIPRIVGLSRFHYPTRGQEE